MRYDVTVIEGNDFTPAQVERFTALGMNCEPRKTTYRDLGEKEMNLCMTGRYSNRPVKVLEVKPVDEVTAEMVTGNGRWGCE